MKNILFYCLLIGLFCINACGVKYSFTGTSINPDVKTVSVERIPNQASLVLPSLSQTLEEKLKDKFTTEARLDLVTEEGHAAFSGTITQYDIRPAASGANDQAALNRLTISVRMEYTNSITEENWSSNFTHFSDFDRDANLTDVENSLIDEITDRIVDDIFNKAFSNW
ncbi:MAG: LptE family protein [Chitinophagales bacterium]